MEADQMVTDCVRTLYQRSDIRIAIPQVLEKLVSFLSADRAYIIHIREGLMYNDYECVPRNCSPKAGFAGNARRIDRPVDSFL